MRACAVLLVALFASTCNGQAPSASSSQRPATPASAPAPFQWQEATLDDLQDAMAAGRLTSRRLVELYLDRIDRLDRQGPRLRSVIEINPDALDIAAALDAERAQRGPRGRLHGIPVLVKDNIDTGDRMLTTAGSLALVGPPAAKDAFIVARLRAAGAVLLGKTNLSEWANIRSSASTSGWSARGGLVRNPYALDRNACGSSSGTGVAIAANLAAVGVGTETDGSIVCPSSVNGLVGIKPTVGLVSRSGIVPISHTQDTAGPMARTVKDAAWLLGTMVGVDARDPATAPSKGRWPANLGSLFEAGSLKGARLGILRGRFVGYSAPADALLDSAVARMRELGATVVDPVELPNAGTYNQSELDVLLYELKADLATYLATRPGVSVRTLADVIAFNIRHAAREMPFFGQDLFIEAEKKGPLTDQAYLRAVSRNRQLSREGGIDSALAAHRLDALVAVTTAPAWTTDLVNGDHYLGSSSTPAAVAGYPSITVPAGLAAGLPVGISFFSTAWTEPRLIRLAYAYEQATRHRVAPDLSRGP